MELSFGVFEVEMMLGTITTVRIDKMKKNIIKILLIAMCTFLHSGIHAYAEKVQSNKVEMMDDDPQSGSSMSNHQDDVENYVCVYGNNRTRAMGAGYIHNSRYNSAYTIVNGIDVSHHNGSINWSAVKASGVDYAMIRVGYRGYTEGSLNEDANFRANIQGALNVGIKVGVYFFSQAITEAEAVQEADYLLARIKGYNIALPVTIDYEYSGGSIGRLYAANLSKSKATAICQEFCDRVKSAGYIPMIYANKSMFENQLNAGQLEKNYQIWLAHYTTQTSYSGDYYVWQYSSKGQINGINGYVDCNFFYEKSNVENVRKYVERCYQYILGRSVDASGLNTWTQKIISGHGGAEIVKDLIISDEFKAKRKNDAEVVEILYQAMLGRGSDPSGKANWLNCLNEGVSYRYIINGFAGSQEFKRICASYGIVAGTSEITEARDLNIGVTGFVMRNYRTILGRDADVDGLNNWCNQILYCGMTPAHVAYGFVFSQEASNKNLNNAQYTEMLYEAILGRNSDASGKNHWISLLNTGMAREQVFWGFANSVEFAQNIASYGL